MFQVTRKQRKLATVGTDDQFATWYVEEIMKPFLPKYHAVLRPEARVTMVINGRRHARAYGIEDPSLQADFITHMWELGPDFHRHPRFLALFSDPHMDENAKMHALRDGTIPETAAVEAAEKADVRYWYLTYDGQELTDG